MSLPTHDDFTAGRLVPLTPRVARLVAPNGGKMTGPGTNSYVISGPGGGKDVAILDAGPADTRHLAALSDALGKRTLRALVVTHTHIDHSPAVAALHERFGALRVGRLSAHPEFQDSTFSSDVGVEEGTRVTGEGWTLRAVLTPGHASNHVCWYLEEEEQLFTGDHVLGTVSPVILPPDGSMRAYLDSLERLKSLPLSAFLPGHGPRLTDTTAVLNGLIRHRLARESKVERELAAAPGSTLAELVGKVYTDVPPDMHPWASYSLLAHLIKLGEDGRAEVADGRWQPIALAD